MHDWTVRDLKLLRAWFRRAWAARVHQAMLAEGRSPAPNPVPDGASAADIAGSVIRRGT